MLKRMAFRSNPREHAGAAIRSSVFPRRGPLPVSLSQQCSPSVSSGRWPLSLLSGAGLSLFAARHLPQPDILYGDDTVACWTRERLNVTGQDLYDPIQLLLLERQAGRPVEDY